MSQVEYGPLAEYYELINESFVPYDDQVAFLGDTIDKFSVPSKPPWHILDVACAAGLLSRRLVDRGQRVVGIDLSEILLTHGVKNNRGKFVCADMRWLPFRGVFDVACCLLHTLNYMTSDSDLRAALESMADAVKPGGLVIADFIAYEPRREWRAKWQQIVRGPGVRIVCKHDQTPDWHTMTATDRHTYTVYEETRTWFATGVDCLRITSASEMRLFAERCRLEVLSICGKYNLNEGPGFDGGVLVTRKPR
ncbi:MAG: class I SAM-dependent methyltransferase [Candidatus Zipacnadales bacterium]